MHAGMVMGGLSPYMRCLHPPPMDRCIPAVPDHCLQPVPYLSVGQCQGNAARCCDKGDAVSISSA